MIYFFEEYNICKNRWVKIENTCLLWNFSVTLTL